MTFWYRAGIYLAILSVYTAGVWHVHTWYDGYKHQKETEVAADKAQKGQNNIIKFNQAMRKVNAQDSCINATVPTELNILLK